MQRPHFSLKYDVTHAHRQVLVVEDDWGRVAGQLGRSYRVNACPTRRVRPLGTIATDRLSANGAAKPGHKPKLLSITGMHVSEGELSEELLVNTVATLGIGSAFCWWGESGGSFGTIDALHPHRQLAVWLVLYSDNCLATARGLDFERPLLFHLFLFSIFGTPFNCPKDRGVTQLEWIGFARFEAGVSEKRAQWCIAWLGDKVRELRVLLGELKEGLGRLVFVAGPL